MNVPRCRLCGTTVNLHYCGQCGVYLCTRCQSNYPARAVGALQTFLQKLFAKRA